MGWLKARRRAVIVAAVVAVVWVGVMGWLYTLLSSYDDGPSMGYYGPEKQQDWAERLVAGLNTHDSEKVPIGRINGKQLSVQKRTVEAAMPAPGCRYEVVSVEDRGEQAPHDVPGLTGQRSTYRFDMTVEEACTGRQTQTRNIGVMAVAEMGYWEPHYFVVD